MLLYDDLQVFTSMSGSYLCFLLRAASLPLYVFTTICTSTCAQVDLKKLGIMDYGELGSGQLGDCANDKLELFFPDKVLHNNHELVVVCKFILLHNSFFYTYECINLKND